MNKLTGILLMLSLLVLQTVTAQSQDRQQEIDSLEKVLAQEKEDSNKVRLLVYLSEAYGEIDLDKSIDMYHSTLLLASRLGMTDAVGHIYIDLGRMYFKTFDSSYFYVRKAIDVSKSSGDSLVLSRAYSDMAVLLEFGANTSGRESENTVNPEALLFIDSAARVNKALNNISGYINDLTRKSEILIYLNRLEEARKVLNLAQSVADSSQRINDRNLTGLYAMKGLYFEKTGEYDSVLAYYKKALVVTDRVKSVRGSAYMRSRIAVAYSKKGLFDKAIEYALSGLKLSDNKLYFKEWQDNITALYEVYKAKGDYKNALKYHELLFHFTDSLNASYMQERISKLNIQLESERHKKEIELLRKDKEISDNIAARQRVVFIALACGILLLIILAFVIHNRYQLKQKALAISEEQNEIITSEKEKSDELLQNILPAEVASDLKERGATTAQQFDHVTVMFTDFVAFTKAGERMGSQALVEELHNCFKGFDEILDKYDIEKIKTIGDAYLAVCGLPTSDERHAEKIVRAAQEILEFINQRRAQPGNNTFEIRIGIHSGSVVAGIVGVKKFAYDIWGDTVNTAARMEQNSEPGKINISESTHELVQDKFTCTYRGELEAKNKGKLKMYFVEG